METAYNSWIDTLDSSLLFHKAVTLNGVIIVSWAHKDQSFGPTAEIFDL